MYYFYVIVSVGGRIGFGITQNPAERNQQYSSHAGDIVKFVYLYGGLRANAKALERTIKTQYSDNLWYVGDWKTEWLKKEVDIKDFKEYVDELIRERYRHLKLVAIDYDFTQDLFE